MSEAIAQPPEGPRDADGPADQADAAPEAPASSVIRTRLGAVTQLALPDAVVTDTHLGDLAAAADACIADHEIRLLLDLGRVQHLTSALLEAMLAVQDRLVRLGGALTLRHVSATGLDVLRITQLKDYVTVEGEPLHAAGAQADRPRLGDQLVARGFCTQEQVDEAVKEQERRGRRLGDVVVERGWVSEQDLLTCLSEQMAVPYARLRSGLWDPEVVQSLEQPVAERLCVAPLFKVRGVVYLATPEPQNLLRLQELEDRLQARVQPVLARRDDILKALGESGEGTDLTAGLLDDVDEDFEVVEGASDDFTAIDEMAGGSPVINTVNAIIQRAVREGASDVHIEPGRNKCRVRFRIDGVLYEIMSPRLELHPALVSRLKVMANLDIAERRLPQDGRIQVQTQGRVVDLRFSSLPGLHGEKVVLRVLDKSQAILEVDKLGMAERTVGDFTSLLGRSHGLLLVTGPTGSGKTTTLYAGLNHLNSIEKNIVTIEDPVEYQLDVINQNEVRNAVGLSFATILKHTLRQDPDVVMVGEIRDRETAEIAVQAALTGHLVLSTLHTNDSAGAITRLIDMGVEPYLLSSALVGVMAQRLVRRICPSCRTTFQAPPEVRERYGWGDQPVSLARGRGCPECFDSGYRGRVAIHEMLEVDTGLQELIMRNPTRDELTAWTERQDIETLFKAGLARVLDGQTTLEEVGRVVSGA